MMNDEKNNRDIETDLVIKKSAVVKAASGLKAYLSDWRNWLSHGLIGVLFLVLAIWAPINIWIKLIVIACLITFNIFRMRQKS
ncbi:MAG: hypothetical protein CVU99_01655 [Firmicutes bacterium HGW-Firmicutes-4]|jgi:hypothetical protein|nr:MAG: hypothetical protein CVU99_01655 [Firmicutes bacterium HGW-Firmicutes-4]